MLTLFLIKEEKNSHRQFVVATNQIAVSLVLICDLDFFAIRVAS